MRYITRLLLSAVILLSGTVAIGANPTPAEFAKDIDQLRSLILNSHAFPFWAVKKEDLAAIVERAKENVLAKDRCDHSCYAELLKVVAAVKDGHSGVSSKSRYEVFGYLPFSVRWFGDELYIVRTSETYKHILGSKIEKVDGVNLKRVLNELKQIVPHTNQSRFKKFSGSYLHLSGLLHGLGITEKPNEVTLTLRNQNKLFESTILRLSPADEKSTKFVNYSVDKKNRPLHLRQRDSNYWFDYDPNSKLLYFQLNRIANMKSEGSFAFNEKMWKLVDSKEVDKFVLDLRYNGGGSFPLSLKFIQAIIDRPNINKRGKLFVISGFDTFSAAIQMLSQLELRTQAIIVGEPPGGPTAHPGDSKSFKLDFTGVAINLSSLYHPSLFLNDRSSEVGLDKEIIERWEDRITGRDPVMDYILRFSSSRRVAASALDFRSYLGTYEYSSTRNLRLKDVGGELWLEVKGALNTPLYPVGGKSLESEVVDFEVTPVLRGLSIRFPGNNSVILARKDSKALSAFDYLYMGELKKAEKILARIKAKTPEYVELKDHQMSFLASIVYFDLLSDSDRKASEIAKGILNMGIRLNDGNAPFCKFSLRFY
ncbi:MAG: hypothetical protein HKN33_05840 [Pyrinomonadaceae bacterium]|nr:hypothetical protein [Pyrinomonadaceae bacterium]